MISLRRRKEEVEEEEEKGRKRTTPKRTRRKKKEPPKPWGRKERLLILVILFLTFGTSAVLALSARDWKLPGLPRLKLPSIYLFGDETIIIEGNKGNPREKEKAEEVKTSFQEITKDLSGVYGLYVVNLETGYSYGLLEEESFQAASLIKLPVILAVYLEAEEGKIDLDEKYTLKDSDKITGSGSLSAKPAGTIITYRELVNSMGQQSDNTAQGIITGILGEETINQTIEDLGMIRTSFEENETTPSDIGRFFQKLWQGKMISEENREEILTSLTDTIYEAWITEGIPSDIQVAHKFGREVHVVNDAGIIFSDSPFVLVIMSKGVVEREADEVFPELARLVFSSDIRD